MRCFMPQLLPGTSMHTYIYTHVHVHMYVHVLCVCVCVPTNYPWYLRDVFVSVCVCVLRPQDSLLTVGVCLEWWWRRRRRGRRNEYIHSKNVFTRKEEKMGESEREWESSVFSPPPPPQKRLWMKGWVLSRTSCVPRMLIWNIYETFLMSTWSHWGETMTS